MARPKRSAKGSFSELKLPVARKYLLPTRRAGLFLAGAVVVLLFLAFVLVDSWRHPGHVLSKGPLSSSHANLEEDCAACHVEGDAPWQPAAVSDQACSTCHEKYGDELGVYSFASHYLYRSQDFQRIVPSEHEMPCADCHVEHEGRETVITRVPDARCTDCHAYGSFNRDHPQFDFAAEGARDDSSLAFAHTHHVSEILQRNGWEDVEKACLACHNPKPDGKTFEAIRFDAHCDSCHLAASVRSAALPVAGGNDPGLGVQTLEAIQQRGGPGSRWAYFLSPAEFRTLGDRVVKSPIYHRDPWILDNLRRLRQELYPEAGLADLLTATADVQPADLKRLYLEAIETLEAQSLELRSRPEPAVQRDLERIDELLDLLRRRLRDPYEPLDETKFLLALGDRNPDLDDERAAAIEALVGELATPCAPCHQVRDATIVRVAADQRTLRRAEFDHRSHIVQRRCLDCHQEIPIEEFLGRAEEIPPGRDEAAIFNLPRLEQCQECHTPQVTSNQCVTCHVFHPDLSRRSELLLYVD